MRSFQHVLTGHNCQGEFLVTDRSGLAHSESERTNSESYTVTGYRSCVFRVLYSLPVCNRNALSESLKKQVRHK